MLYINIVDVYCSYMYIGSLGCTFILSLHILHLIKKDNSQACAGVYISKYKL